MLTNYVNLLAANIICGINRVQVIRLRTAAVSGGHSAGPTFARVVTAGAAGSITDTGVIFIYPGEPYGRTASDINGCTQINGLPTGAAADGCGGSNRDPVLRRA